MLPARQRDSRERRVKAAQEREREKRERERKREREKEREILRRDVAEVEERALRRNHKLRYGGRLTRDDDVPYGFQEQEFAKKFRFQKRVSLQHEGGDELEAILRSGLGFRHPPYLH